MAWRPGYYDNCVLPSVSLALPLVASSRAASTSGRARSAALWRTRAVSYSASFCPPPRRTAYLDQSASFRRESTLAPTLAYDRR